VNNVFGDDLKIDGLRIQGSHFKDILKQKNGNEKGG
jgi:hypothetical protein